MKKFALDKRIILKKSRQFNEVFQQGQRISSKNFIIFFKSSSDTKVGFTVSQKIKGAVRRNRAKRRLREIFRLNQQNLPQNMTMVLMAKTGVERTKFEALVDEYTTLLAKIKFKYENSWQSHN